MYYLSKKNLCIYILQTVLFWCLEEIFRIEEKSKYFVKEYEKTNLWTIYQFYLILPHLKNQIKIY